MTDGVLQLADIEFTVNMRDCLGNQFIGIEINSIGVLVVDGIPEFLELCFFKPSVQRIFQNLWLLSAVSAHSATLAGKQRRVAGDRAGRGLLPACISAKHTAAYAYLSPGR